MEAQNSKERTRSILQFAALLLVASMLMGSTFYFPMKAHMHSYDKIMTERNGLSQKMEREDILRKGFNPMVNQLYGIQLKADTVLGKMQKASANELVSLKNRLSDVQTDAEESRKLYRRLLKEKPVKNDSIFYRFSDLFEMSLADKATIAAQLEELSGKPDQNRLAALEQENASLKDKIDDLRDKLRAANAGGGGTKPAASGGSGESKKLEEYQAKLQRIQRNVDQIQAIVKDIDHDKVEGEKGKKRFYRIDNMTDFSTRINRVQDICGVIMDEMH
jgi:hypothetical protein